MDLLHDHGAAAAIGAVTKVIHAGGIVRARPVGDFKGCRLRHAARGHVVLARQPEVDRVAEHEPVLGAQVDVLIGGDRLGREELLLLPPLDLRPVSAPEVDGHDPPAGVHVLDPQQQVPPADVHDRVAERCLASAQVDALEPGAAADDQRDAGFQREPHDLAAGRAVRRHDLVQRIARSQARERAGARRAQRGALRRHRRPRQKLVLPLGSLGAAYVRASPSGA